MIVVRGIRVGVEPANLSTRSRSPVTDRLRVFADRQNGGDRKEKAGTLGGKGVECARRRNGDWL